MSIKKMLLVASMALAAVAFAAPGMASAAEWTHEGEPLAEEVTVQFEGTAKFEDQEGNGVECTDAYADVDLEPGSTGKVTSFGPTNVSNCHVLGSLGSVCSLEEVTSLALPWEVDVNAANFTITGVHIINHMSGGFFCEVAIGSAKEITLSGNVTATPDNTAAISSITLSGSLSSSLGGSVVVSGTMQGTPAGTYGIG